jgi:hypothetical protein
MSKGKKGKRGTKIVIHLGTVKGRDFLHLEHVTNGFKEGAHGPDKRATRKRDRKRDKQEARDQ